MLTQNIIRHIIIKVCSKLRLGNDQPKRVALPLRGAMRKTIGLSRSFYRGVAQFAPTYGWGEKCRWRFARQSSLENWFFKDEVAGSLEASRIPPPQPRKIESVWTLFFLPETE